MDIGKMNADELYRRVMVIQNELLITTDKYVADVLIDRLEAIKRAIEETKDKDLISKTQTVTYKRNDSRIPAYKGNIIGKRVGYALIAIIICIAIGVGSYFAYNSNMEKKKATYEAAIELMYDDFAGAYNTFLELGNYEQSSSYAAFCSICMDLQAMESSEEPVTISSIENKLNEFDKYNYKISNGFENLQAAVDKAKSYYGTYWEGGGYQDSASKEFFTLGVKIDNYGNIKATSFRTDGFLVDATWSYADEYTMYYYQGQICGIDNKYNDYMDVFFGDGYVEYKALSRLTKDEYTLYQK